MSRVYVSASAKRHRVSASRIRAALRHAGMPELVQGDRMFFLGIDDRGVLLELIAVPWPKDEEQLMVIHAMPYKWRGGRGGAM